MRPSRRKIGQFVPGGTDEVPSPAMPDVSSAVTSDWPNLRLPVGEAIALGTLKSCLETRTKDLVCARVIGMYKPKGEMKVIVGFRADRGSVGHVTMRPRTPGASRFHCEKRRT